jgi:hypothetical protein
LTCTKSERQIIIPPKKHALLYLGGFFLHPMRSGSRKSTNDRKVRGLQKGLLELVCDFREENIKFTLKWHNNAVSATILKVLIIYL